jgi:molecular chaperone HtpG
MAYSLKLCSLSNKFKLIIKKIKMSTQKGKINVNTENIFPIIKKFLYSDHEIFLRELVSNAVDATQKVKKLASSGELKEELGDIAVEIKVNKEQKTVTISDKGIGMTAEEIEKYINQVAFSSAEEFIEKFKNVDGGINIIGHFGLGFYSAFMVSEKVEIISKSFKNEPAVMWSCDGSPEFEMSSSDKTERGTDIILHISEESIEFADENKIGDLLNKYCKFLPIPIKFGQDEITEKDAEDKEIKVKKDRIINNPTPAWTLAPADLKDEDYLNFYRELYPFTEDPLFWIHLNVDFPFKLTGILYFPKLKKTYEVQKNKIQLYSNQVFVTDNVEQIVPEYLMMMHGVLDSPDIPLNVSRSYLQSDSNVKKITAHISKKVADKLGDLFKNDRTSYDSKWESIGLFVKYGMISDDKFYDRAKDFCLYQNIEKKLFTLEAYKLQIEALQLDKNGKIVVLYSTDQESQDAYIQGATKKGYDVLLFDEMIDQHFIQHMESKNADYKFSRVDADTFDKMIEKDETLISVLSSEEEEALKKVFQENVPTEGVHVELKALSPDDMPVMITKNEFMRRMADMSKLGGGGMYSFMGNMPESFNLVVNTNHPIASKLLQATDKVEMIKNLYDLALLQQGMLKGSHLTAFINRSVESI